ncbi:MAG TPA: methyl-accepting chemotaxis protein, partial [Stellaceae bacterium]|nr:methyl-accepting chemotaxis protein [Stellaceae bacterium]
MRNLKLGQKIYFVVILLAVVAELISYVGITAMQTYNQQLRQMRHLSKAAILGEQVNGLILTVQMDSRNLGRTRDPAEAEKFAAPIERNLALIKQKTADWIEISEAQDRAAKDHGAAAIAEFVKSRTELVQLARQASPAQARASDDSDQYRANQAALSRVMETLTATDAAHISELTARTQDFYEGKLITMITLAGLGILLALLAIFIVVTNITRPISRLTERVTENIRRVAIAATQASAAVSQVSDGSNVQLTALRQSGAALGQSTEAITEVARSTQMASEQAKEAANLVADGIRRMDTMVDVVNAISENSSQISQIAGAISRIAGQTNMLSLNAAIEAARAGEHGKGFAVVAEEVRKLAENSGSLAQEIASLVQHATEAAGRGVAMAREVSDNMHQIAEGVQQSDRLVGAIATAMEEQEMTVRGINT